MTNKEPTRGIRRLARALHRHWLVVIGAVLAVGIVSLAALLLVPGKDTDTASQSDTPDASTTHTGTSDPPETESGDASAESDSDAAIHALVEADEAIRQMDEETTDEQVDVDAVAQDFVKGELEATESEYAANGWHQEGSVEVADVQEVDSDRDSDPQTVTLRVCLDSSDVTIVDESGDPVGQDHEAPDRVPHLYTLVRADGGWKAAEHSFPEESSC